MLAFLLFLLSVNLAALVTPTVTFVAVATSVVCCIYAVTVTGVTDATIATVGFLG